MSLFMFNTDNTARTVLLPSAVISTQNCEDVCSRQFPEESCYLNILCVSKQTKNKNQMKMYENL